MVQPDEETWEEINNQEIGSKPKDVDASLDLGLQLERAKKELRETPQSNVIRCNLLKMRVQNLEYAIRAQCRMDEFTEPLTPPRPPTGVRAPHRLNEQEAGPTAGTPTNERASVENEAQELLAPSQVEALYSEVRDNIKSTEQKVMFLLVVVVWLMLSLISRNAPTSWFYGPAGWRFTDLLSLLSMFGLSCSAYAMLRVLYPSHKEFNPLKLFATKLYLLQRGFLIGAIAAALALLYMIISKMPHPRYFPPRY